MRNTLFIIFFFVSIITQAQTLKIQYEKSSDFKHDASLSSIIPYSVIITPTQSLSLTGPLKLKHDRGTEVVEEKEDKTLSRVSSNHYMVKSKTASYLYKDYTNDILSYHTTIHTKKVEVSEKVSDLFDWKITTKDTIFLDLPCKIATSKFRGQNWTVFFTEEFGLAGGPWKFDNLPGVILHAFTEDKTYTFSATELSLEKDTQVLDNPFKDKNLLSFNEFKKQYKKKVMEQLKAMKSLDAEGETSTNAFKMVNPMEDLGLNEVVVK